MKFTLRQLTVFTVLAQTEHFGRAADILHLAQPTVSADIKALERALKVVLFHRSRAGTTLTPAGEKLLFHAQAIVSGAEELARVGQEISAERSQRIKLAATPSLVNRLVPNLLQEIANGSDGLQVEAMEVPTGQVGEAIESGMADVGIGHFVDPPAGCARETIGHNELWLLAEAGKLTPTEPADLTAMAGRKLMVWPREHNPEYYDVLLSTCQERGLDPQTQVGDLRIPGPYAFLLTSGQAFALVPEGYARETPASLSYARLSPRAHIPLHAIWRLPLAPSAAKLIAALRRSQHNLVVS